MSQIFYPVAEKFVSINGEGRKAGELALFIRFRKCNLYCSYCDTLWANQDNSPAEWLSLESLIEYAETAGIKNITLTGGEPLLQEHLAVLITALMKKKYEIEIETNGSIEIKNLALQPYRPAFTLDYKLPSSRMEKFMLTENYQYLDKNLDVVKFVVGSQQDLEKACQIIRQYDLLNKAMIYFSPVFGQIEPVEIVEFMKQKNLNQIRLQLQLHKFIWNPEQGGV